MQRGRDHYTRTVWPMCRDGRRIFPLKDAELRVPRTHAPRRAPADLASVSRSSFETGFPFRTLMNSSCLKLHTQAFVLLGSPNLLHVCFGELLVRLRRLSVPAGPEIGHSRRAHFCRRTSGVGRSATVESERELECELPDRRRSQFDPIRSYRFPGRRHRGKALFSRAGTFRGQHKPDSRG